MTENISKISRIVKHCVICCRELTTYKNMSNEALILEELIEYISSSLNSYTAMVPKIITLHLSATVSGAL